MNPIELDISRYISAYLYDVYGIDISAEMISHMTGRILHVAREWQNRPLENKYTIVFMDAIHFHVCEDNRTVKKAVYVAIGIKLNGQKEVLGMWAGGNESTKYWLGVLNKVYIIQSKAFMKNLKLAYKADAEELALAAMDDLEKTWGNKYVF